MLNKAKFPILLWTSDVIFKIMFLKNKDTAMFRLFLIIVALCSSSLFAAQSNYQIDVIFFAHPQTKPASESSEQNTSLIPTNRNAISLKSAQGKTSGYYQLLPASSSTLRDEYYLLSRKSKYQVLAHYSWKQPANSQSAVALPDIDSKGWRLHGVMQIRQSNYYLLNTTLQIEPPYQPQAIFSIKHKQRLKGNAVYYLDNAKVGMLIKIHSLV